MSRSIQRRPRKVNKSKKKSTPQGGVYVSRLNSHHFIGLIWW